jgi:hypothetical protein
MHVERSSKPANSWAAECEWEPHDWSMLSPKAVHQDRVVFHCMVDLQLGPVWDGRENSYIDT